jgi:polyferredoxin
MAAGLQSSGSYVSAPPPAQSRRSNSTEIAASRKKLTRRKAPEYSQPVRRVFQASFLLLNLWIGGAFYVWVRHFEAGARGPLPPRPAGVEGWLPIAGLMNLKYWVNTGHVPATHPAALFLFVSFLATAFLFRKSFCSWLCPVGTVSEYLWRAGKRILRRNLVLPRWIDLPLRCLKYLFLGFFVWAVANMPAASIELFMRSAYGAMVDVRMLNFFRDLGEMALIVFCALIVFSLLVQNFWCRYLCPYGALLGLASLLSPLRIRRYKAACIDCAKCAKACPSALPVDRLITIKSAECTGRLECVAVCPASGALDLSLPVWGQISKHRPMPAWAMAAGIAILFFGIVGYAKTAGYWNGDIPDYVYRQLVPQARAIGHP